MKVLITGIEGFVGSVLARHLARAGYEVSGIYFVAPTTDLSFARIGKCDIRNAAQLKAELAQVKPDCVVHLAAVSSVVVAERDLAETFDINVRGTLHLLEAIRQLESKGTRCRIESPSRILLVSSSEVYDPKPGDMTETVDGDTIRHRVPLDSAGQVRKLDENSPVKPMNHYAFTKLCAEQLGLYYVSRYDLDIVILRPFSHTGPGQSRNFVFPSVARQIAEAELGRRPPEIQVGNTDVSRDYTDVRDVCRAYELALTRCTKGEVYNITSENVWCIGDGIKFLAGQAKVPIEVKVAPDRVRQENVLLAGSSAKFRAATGWQANHDLHDSLTAVLEYERQQADSA